MSTFVKDAMTTQVIWVEQDTPFAAIAAALREYRVSAFPVLDGAGAVIGVVSESDLLAKLALGGGEDGTPGLTTPRPDGRGFRPSRAGVPVSLPIAPGRTRSV